MGPAAAGAPPTRRRPGPGGAAGRSQEPEVPRGAGRLAKPARRNCLEAPPPAGSRGCRATGAGAAGGLCARWSEPGAVAPDPGRGLLASRPPPRRALLASRNPCPWHYSHLPASRPALAPVCLGAPLHRKRGSPAPVATPGWPDAPSPAMSTYTYTSRPRPPPCQHRRYRDDLLPLAEEPTRYGNIMYDRRVVRGNTYALQMVLPAGPDAGLLHPTCTQARRGRLLPNERQQTQSLTSARPDPVEVQKQHQAKRKTLARKRAQDQLRPRTPEAVEGRKHVDVQTELYLEEIADRIIEVDMECQTDAFLDRPPTPLFIPAKTGMDVATQILEGELFDFDLEVKPMLEVLVGKTIEQALLEVMEEEELANLQARQHAYEELRSVELAEVQRLEEQERRHREEKERRKQQQWEMVNKHSETAQKIAAHAFAQRYLADLFPSVFHSLREGGYFYDPIERDRGAGGSALSEARRKRLLTRALPALDIEIGFLPWLMNEVDKAMEHSMVGRTVLDMLIREVVERRLAMYEWKASSGAPARPEDAPGGPEAEDADLLGHYEDLLVQGSPQAPQLPEGRGSLQRAPFEDSFMESMAFPEGKFLEEEEEQRQRGNP
ncbi:Radial spoke head protein 3 [Galemys pyrenaicus]|uniref:Radial spoke head protein 3 n=1 Tax=Galemys pyrenaicus TaxID=202257 RepID=A0A8J6DVJ9_GALPY|nr:Radial spoke head protein 3 [Galemys pyrenaicus]